jgi:hypothetical protein
MAAAYITLDRHRNGRRETFYNQAYLFVKRVGNKDGLLDIKLDVLFFFGF